MTRRIVAAYGITWLTDFAGTLLVFAVTRSLAEQRVGTLTMGLISGGFAAALSLSTYFGGRIADRFGHIKVIVAATLLLLPCLMCVALVDSANWWYYLAYVGAGGAVGMVYPPTVAWLTLSHRGPSLQRKLFGFCLVWNLGMISGHTLGGQLFGVWGHSAVLFSAISLLPLSLLLAAWGRRGDANSPDLVEENQEVETRDNSTELAAAFAVLGWVANVGGTFSMSVILFLLPDLSVQIGVTSEHQGGIVAFSRGVVIATYLLMAIARYWRFRFAGAVGSQALAVMGLIYLAAASNERELIIGLVVFSILPAYNYFSSLFYSTVGSAAQRRGTWVGIHESTFGVGLTLGSILGGWIGSYAGVRSSFLLAAVVVCALTIVQTILYIKLVLPLHKSRSCRASKERPDWSLDDVGVMGRDSKAIGRQR